MATSKTSKQVENENQPKALKVSPSKLVDAIEDAYLQVAVFSKKYLIRKGYRRTAYQVKAIGNIVYWYCEFVHDTTNTMAWKFGRVEVEQDDSESTQDA